MLLGLLGVGPLISCNVFIIIFFIKFFIGSTVLAHIYVGNEGVMLVISN